MTRAGLIAAVTISLGLVALGSTPGIAAVQVSSVVLTASPSPSANESPAQTIARNLCRKGNELLGQGFTAFLNKGPGNANGGRFAVLWQNEVRGAQNKLKAIPGASKLAALVSDLEHQATGYYFLYTFGETEYQNVKKGHDVDALQAKVARDWPIAMKQIFKTGAPTAPIYPSPSKPICG